MLYVAVEARGQVRTIYLAFNYWGDGDSGIRVIDSASDKRDKCAFQAAAPTSEFRSVAPTKKHSLTVINHTQLDIIGFYASAVSSDEWGDNSDGNSYTTRDVNVCSVID